MCLNRLARPTGQPIGRVVVNDGLKCDKFTKTKIVYGIKYLELGKTNPWIAIKLQLSIFKTVIFSNFIFINKIAFSSYAKLYIVNMLYKKKKIKL